jgi:hypothetical protein
MQVWLNDSEIPALIAVADKESKRIGRQANALHARAYKLTDRAYNFESLKYQLEDAVRAEMDAFDRD